MPDELSVGKLAVDIQPYLDSLGLAQQASAKATQAIVDGSARITKSFADLAQQQVDSTNRIAAQVAEYRNAQEAVRSAAEAVREYAAREKELRQQQKGLNSATAEYQRITKELEKNKRAIAEAKQAQQEGNAAAREAQRAAQGIAEANRQATQQVKLEAAASRDAAAAAKQQASATEGASKSTGLFSGLLQKAGGFFAGLFAVQKVVEVGEEIRRVTAELEKYEIVLTGAFNGDQGRAQRALIQVRNFADANGLEITALTDTYVKLVNRGIIPTTEQLRQLSDIAATSGKSTDQFVEALLDAQTGEFERLKEFGIKVKNNGDTISFSFKGVKTEVKNTQDAISQYLFALGDAQGVQGQAAAQLKSLGGAAADSKNAFTELYQVIGERSKSVFGALSNATAGAARALANYFKSTDQEALEQSASSIDRYAKFIGAVFTQVATDTKAKGGDVTEALNQAANDQIKFIDARLAKAKRDLAAYYKSAQEASAAGGGEVDAIDPAQITRFKTAIKLYEGQREAAKRAYQTSVEGAGAEADAVGRIAALRVKIAAEEKARDAAPDTNAGNKERVRLVAQLVTDNKLLNELLGKQDKAQQAINDKLAAALRALEQERATLTSLAAKALEKSSDDAATRARLAFEEQIRQIEIVKQKLIEREAAVRKAGGKKGADTDGKLDAVQQGQINTLNGAAQEQYTKELERIERERAALLLSLRAETDQRELDQLEATFNEQVRLHENEAGVLLALEAKYERDRQALLDSQATKRAQHEQRLSSSQADATSQVYGSGTGQSFFEAQLSARQQQLDSEQTLAEKRLDIIKNNHSKEADEERAALAAQLLRIRQQKIALKIEATTSKFSLYKLILGENDDERTRAALDKVVGEAVNALGQIISAEEQAAAARVQIANQNIQTLSQQLAAEIELHRDGSASNIKGLQDQIAAEKTARREALAEQRSAAKEKVILDTITQASSLITASAEIFAAFSGIPIIGVPLAIAAIAAMGIAFAAAKVSAFQAAGSIGEGSFFVGGEYEGGYTGDGNPREVSTAQGARPYEYHKREFIMNHELTDKYRDSLFKPLHEGQPLDWSHPTLLSLLPDYSLPGKLKEERQQYITNMQLVSTKPLEQKLDSVIAELAHIKGSNQNMADLPTRTVLPDGSIFEQYPNGNTNHLHFK